MWVAAVDSPGSVTFGGSAGRRMISGLGTGVRPPMLDEAYLDEVINVEEGDTVRACHQMARRGLLFGGSTGTVVSGALRWLGEHDGLALTAVAVAPDFGERDLHTVYQSNWVTYLHGAEVLHPEAAPMPSARGDAVRRTARHPAAPPLYRV
jgi:cysteine synthase A